MPLFEAYGVEPVIEGMLSRRVDLPERRLPDDRLRRGADGHRRQHGLVHRQGQERPARGHDHARRTWRRPRRSSTSCASATSAGSSSSTSSTWPARATATRCSRSLRKALDEDRTKTFVVEISPLGLVEMTRQNVTDGAREIMTKTCPTCGGEGVVKSEETIAIEVERRLRELVADAGAGQPRGVPRPLEPEGHGLLHGRRRAHAARARGGHGQRFFHFEGSEGLPLDHFAITAVGTPRRDRGARRAVPRGRGGARRHRRAAHVLRGRRGREGRRLPHRGDGRRSRTSGRRSSSGSRRRGARRRARCWPGRRPRRRRPRPRSGARPASGRPSARRRRGRAHAGARREPPRSRARRLEALLAEDRPAQAGTGPARPSDADEDAAEAARPAPLARREAPSRRPRAAPRRPTDEAADGGRGRRGRRGTIEDSAPWPQRRTAPFAREGRSRRRRSLRSQRVT